MTRPAPVLVLGPPFYYGPLGLARSLGRLGVPVYSPAHRGLSLIRASRHCAGTLDIGVDGRPLGKDPERVLEELLAAGRRLGQGTILVAGSDEWALFVADHAERLAGTFRFPSASPELIRQLGSKVGLQRLAERHGVPTPRLVRPESAAQLVEVSAALEYPVMVKPILSRPGLAVRLVESRQALLERFSSVPDADNLLLQEYIPGGDEAVWMFDGYFDASSRCLFGLTGQKLRQHPARMGISSLGLCVNNQEVVDLTTRFLGELGYQGLVDIGYRYDRRDGRYKILDVNPRLGGAFRLFVDGNGLDVTRVLYYDLTGRPVPPVVPRDGRRWLVEAADVIAARHYGLGRLAWLRSLRGVDESATLSLRDPLPFVVDMAGLVQRTLGGRLEQRRRRSRARAIEAGAPA